jgi:hypothetical protein
MNSTGAVVAVIDNQLIALPQAGHYRVPGLGHARVLGDGDLLLGHDDPAAACPGTTRRQRGSPG